MSLIVVNKTNLSDQGEKRLIRIRVSESDALGNPITCSRYRSQGLDPIRMNDWKEVIVLVTAHEVYHHADMEKGLYGKAVKEFLAEHFSRQTLRRYRRNPDEVEELINK